MNISSPSTAILQEGFGNASPPRCAIMDEADSREMSLNLKLPPFDPQDPQSWFKEAEGIFTKKKIRRPASKFYHVVQILPYELCGPIWALMYPPDSGSVPNVYDKLRDQLMAECKRLQTSRTQKILQGQENQYHDKQKRKHDKILPVVPYGWHFMAEMKHETGMQGPKMKQTSSVGNQLLTSPGPNYTTNSPRRFGKNIQ